MIFHADIQLDRTAVPFWPRHRTTKVALIKAPKYKANLTTGEVRLENRNRDGRNSNKTFERLLGYQYFQKLLPRKGTTCSSPDSQGKLVVYHCLKIYVLD